MVENKVVNDQNERIVEHLVDYAYRELNAYEVALYLYLLRKTILGSGSHEIRLGKRTLQSEFVHAKRGGGKNNSGGIWVNYEHITKILKGLEAKGCIDIGDAAREGTLYVVKEPLHVPFIAKALSAKMKVEPEVEDYFNDVAKRLELFVRDKWHCAYCGDLVNKTNATLDHYVPQSKGGGHTKENLRTCCFPCNSIKGGHSIEEAAVQLLKAAAERKAKLTT